MVPESWLQSAGHSNTGDPDQNDFSENVTLIRQIRPDLTRSWVSFCSNSNLSIRRCPISPQVPALRKCNFSFISEMKMLVCSEIFIEYFPCGWNFEKWNWRNRRILTICNGNGENKDEQECEQGYPQQAAGCGAGGGRPLRRPSLGRSVGHLFDRNKRNLVIYFNF